MATIKKKNIFKLNYYLDHMKRFHNVIRVDFMDIRAVKHRISGKGFFLWPCLANYKLMGFLFLFYYSSYF